MANILRWNLRQLLAQQGIFKTTDLVPLLAERGVALSREQVYRLVANEPQRLNLEVLLALCEILDCSPNDLLVLERVEQARPKRQAGGRNEVTHLDPVKARIMRPKA